MKLLLQKTTTVPEFITVKVKRNNGPLFLYQSFKPVEGEYISNLFQTLLEEYLTDPLLVGSTQSFVCGDLNIDLIKANSLSQNLENLFACSDMTLKTLKATTTLNHNGHSSRLDVIFSNCELTKSGIVSSTVSDDEIVYAVIGDDSVKHNATIGDYRKLGNPESSVGAVFYLQTSLQKEYLKSFFLNQKLDVLTNCLVHTFDKYCPLILKKLKWKQDWCTKVMRKSIQERNKLRSIYLKDRAAQKKDVHRT